METIMGSDYDFINEHMGGHDEDGMPNFMGRINDDYNTELAETEAGEGHTYDKWQELGYQVRRGEKATYKHYGKSIFTADQVDEI